MLIIFQPNSRRSFLAAVGKQILSGKKFMRKIIRRMIIIIAALSLPGWAVAAPIETLLYRFKGGDDGAAPNGLIADSRGALYGTTYDSGSSGKGTIFKLTLSPMTPSPTGQKTWTWSKTVLYRFKGGNDGAGPGGLIADPRGALYGTTSYGGSSGKGTVFKLTPPARGQTAWTETVLYRFKGGSDGAGPGGLIADNRGALYGTTSYGGSSGKGTVFKLTPPAQGQTAWTKTVLYTFKGGSDGAGPGSLIADSRGALYGTTYRGGIVNGCSWSPPGPESTGSGCGTIFKLVPPARGQIVWTETVVYRFKGWDHLWPNLWGGVGDGASPVGKLIVDSRGALYGTTRDGGYMRCPPLESFGCGTIFKLTPPAGSQTAWTETVLHKFRRGDDGYSPGEMIMDMQGALYGITHSGGSEWRVTCGFGALDHTCGTVFKLTPPTWGQTAWTETVLYTFKGGIDGNYPTSLIMDKQGALYGTTNWGGSPSIFQQGYGTIFKLTLSPSSRAVSTEDAL